jgi:hypothetical protein
MSVRYSAFAKAERSITHNRDKKVMQFFQQSSTIWHEFHPETAFTRNYNENWGQQWCMKNG